jgi:TolB protein
LEWFAKAMLACSTAAMLGGCLSVQRPVVPAIPIPGDHPPVVVDAHQLKGRIAFAYNDGIWVSNADGSGRTQLTRDGGFDPAWSPDGRQIVYRRLLSSDDGEIWIMDGDGGRRRNLVEDPEASDWGPAWSPDGATVAFNSDRDGILTLWLMDAHGGHQRAIGNVHAEYPSWSPDGARIAYAGGPYYDIRICKADGSDDHALTTSPAYDMGPAWSPDGTWIAYHTQADSYPQIAEPGMGSDMEIHLIHPDGTGDHRITADTVEDSFPTWSPDGRFLMWARHGELVVARPDGTGPLAIGPGNFPSWIAQP